MPRLRRYLSWFILGICTVILIVACDRGAYLEGNRPPNSLTSDRPTPASSESCRLVSHEMGETEVCGQPQKVAALSPHILDSILALGVQPAAYAESIDLKIQTYDNPQEQILYPGQWVKTQPIGVGDRYSPSLERLTLVQPDLILGEKLYNQDEYPSSSHFEGKKKKCSLVKIENKEEKRLLKHNLIKYVILKGKNGHQKLISTQKLG
ncbi:hypothetical protein H1P_1770008 [Hyella patelloides LEGE 07179]|uniref:Fe/B12 periplasmic-binding domain-containing protein n=1 Tax=Hyella patelloides LEGE 07179 TaxID=945734 RepID=A0A563VNK2_9CYAN|nr:hypothetical protein [Hyella patelloides]VEP13001.1 hypothetical protein H1P_1770008 [Hyella patelloides LEGE 07179]